MGPHLDRTREFRDYFTGYLLRVIVGTTWWVGAVIGVLALWRRGSVLDAPWGLIAGTAAGIAGSATVGSVVLFGDLIPHFIWEKTLATSAVGVVALPLWALLVLLWWTFLGVTLGVGLTALGPLGRPFLTPFQSLLAGACRLVRMRRLGDFFAPL